MASETTKFTYAVGQKIRARDPSSNTWRNAVVMSLAPYRGRPGYYINWDPVPMDFSSTGGWTYEACMSEREATPSDDTASAIRTTRDLSAAFGM